MDQPVKITKKCRFDEAGPLSKLVFSWLIPLFKVGLKKDLEFDDLDVCCKADDPETLTSRLEKNWECELMKEKCKKGSASFMLAVVKTFLPGYAFQVFFLGITECVFRVAQPIMVGYVVRHFMKNESVSIQIATWCCVGIIVSSIVFAFVRNQYYFFVGRIGINIHSALTVVIYKKLLKMSNSSFEVTSIGKITNIISNDIQRFTEICWTLGYVAIAPVQSIIVMYIMWGYLGRACLGGIVILILFIPFQVFMGRLFNQFRQKTTDLTDTRVKMMTEIIAAMKVIKMYCWEKPFADSINDIRLKEVKRLKWSALLEGMNWSIALTSTRVMLFASFIAHVFLGGSLDAETVFVTLSLFNVISHPLTSELPHAVGLMGESFVTTKRIQHILMLPEKGTIISDSSRISKKGSVSFTKFYAKWNSSLQKDSLKNVNIQVDPGELLVVIGSVGSGKTCLLYAILSEIERVSGGLSLNGVISYSPQESWCFGGSIRENILLGEKMDHKKYQAVIKACGLERDLKLFPSGDQTFVGEKGYTLSGGQKARVTLARAVYRDADIYLLDDPLSAVDPHVANHIFDKCINGYLKEKTVILITHQLQLIKESDKIAVMNDGFNLVTGTYKEILTSGVDIVAFLEKRDEDLKRQPSHSGQRSREASMTVSISRSHHEEEELQTPSYPDDYCEVEGKSDREEMMALGSVGARVYWEYFRSGASFFYLGAVILITSASQVAYNYNDYWLSLWTENYKPNANGTIPKASIHTERDNLLIYTGLMLALFTFYLGRVLLSFFMCLNCSIELHNRIFRSVVRAHMSFFETNPIGRILNRFTKDVGTIDQWIPYIVMDLNICVIESLGVMVISAVVDPWLILPAVVLVVFSIPLREIYLRTGRDVKRLESIVRSPVYSHISATFDGLTTVRAFGLEDRFINQYYRYMRDSTSTRFLSMASARGVAFALDCLSLVYIAAINIFIIFSNGLEGGMVGVVLSNATLLIGMFQFAIRSSAEFETQMISVERVLEYGRLPPEPPLKFPDAERPWLKTWPSSGTVEFKNVSLTYDKEKNAKKVLKKISFKVVGGEKVGIVGRTGAGKSSLISVLFRLVEPEGTIFIDDVDTKKLGLHELRGKVSIIPQDPVLFYGSVRRNLDPFGEYPDDVLWSCLRSADLHQTVQTMDGGHGLDGTITEGGSNLSVGQRQLMCLARALLKQNRILVLDEATANVDQETDELIQKTIKTNFSHCTVLTIAHRLNTIIDMDKVLVLDAGQVIEFDAPHLLLSKPERTEAGDDFGSGLFKDMVNQTGKEFSKMLHKVAEETFHSRLKTENSLAEKTENSLAEKIENSPYVKNENSPSVKNENSPSVKNENSQSEEFNPEKNVKNPDE